MKTSKTRITTTGLLALAAVLAIFFLWRLVFSLKKPARPLAPPKDRSLVLVTGYCNCEQCCGWERSWFGFGRPVYTYGPLKGRPKKVGMTARGTTAKKGTVAADPIMFPFGTRLAIPGYGTGIVEDVGGAIKGRHVDVWFPTHEEARRWGRRELAVKPIRSR
jgi:3D (Asp-Asp-Asp) domain-containing protein